ncbi:MAG: GNAT family N-acetyltransferase [candidate division WOR-3 bacterium]|nr:GNAT family N-acetyltransferase [candidate division WOR-3 bacterium]
MWGWDEEFQKKYFDEHFRLEDNYIIEIDNQKGGVVSFEEQEDLFFIRNLELLPEFQRKGIGTSIIIHILKLARLKNKDLELQVFKINPARKLYEKLGFKIIDETDIHYKMRYHIR